MADMSTRQRITLAEFLATTFAKARAEKLNGEALEEMTVGERYAAKFGGIVAAWVSLPNPPNRASVSNKALFTAWVKKHLPDEIETVEIVRPGTQASLLAAAKANDGMWLNKETGEAVKIDGITFGVGDPSPRVELTGDAAEAIGSAWQRGEIDLTPMLALAAPVSDKPGSVTTVQTGRLLSVCQSKFQLKRAEHALMVTALGRIAGRDLTGDLGNLSEAEAARVLDTLEQIPGREQLEALVYPAAAAEDVAAA